MSREKEQENRNKKKEMRGRYNKRMAKDRSKNSKGETKK
jgi:hypothetical protein